MEVSLTPAGQALEQRETQMRLERPDLIADGAGGQPQLGRSGAETRGSGGRLEGPSQVRVGRPTSGRFRFNLAYL